MGKFTLFFLALVVVFIYQSGQAYAAACSEIFSENEGLIRYYDAGDDGVIDFSEIQKVMSDWTIDLIYYSEYSDILDYWDGSCSFSVWSCSDIKDDYSYLLTAYDDNGNGVIDSDELSEATSDWIAKRNIRITDKELAAVDRAYNLGNNCYFGIGGVYYSAVNSCTKAEQTSGELSCEYDLDGNNNGEIDSDELTEAQQDYSNGQISKDEIDAITYLYTNNCALTHPTSCSSALSITGESTTRGYDKDNNGKISGSELISATQDHASGTISCFQYKGMVYLYAGNCDIGTNQPPNAEFSWSPQNPKTGENIQFTDTSTDPDGTSDIKSRDWDFGDGSSSAQQNPTHSYSSEGTYNVKLVVTDSAGNTDEEGNQVTVTKTQANEATITSFTCSPTALGEGDIANCRVRIDNPSNVREARIFLNNAEMASSTSVYSSSEPFDFTFVQWEVNGNSVRVEISSFYGKSGTLITQHLPANVLKVEIEDKNTGNKDSAEVEIDFQQAGCDCTTWTNDRCGRGSCGQTMMRQTRTCTPTGCDDEERCIPDGSCGGPSCQNGVNQNTGVCDSSNCGADPKCDGISPNTDLYECDSNNQRLRCDSSCQLTAGSCEDDYSGCNADSACDGRNPGDSCGSGKICDASCKCVGSGTDAKITSLSCDKTDLALNEKVTCHISVSNPGRVEKAWIDSNSETITSTSPGITFPSIDEFDIKIDELTTDEFCMWIYDYFGATSRNCIERKASNELKTEIRDKTSGNYDQKTVTFTISGGTNCYSDGTNADTGRCDSECGADSGCHGIKPGDSCGSGKVCDSSCKCVSTSTTTTGELKLSLDCDPCCSLENVNNYVRCNWHLTTGDYNIKLSDAGVSKLVLDFDVYSVDEPVRTSYDTDSGYFIIKNDELSSSEISIHIHNTESVSKQFSRKSFYILTFKVLDSSGNVLKSTSKTITGPKSGTTTGTTQQLQYSTSPCQNYGDVNDDGRIDEDDMKMVTKASIRRGKLDEMESKRADVNFDGRADINDALLISDYMNGKEASFPVCGNLNQLPQMNMELQTFTPEVGQSVTFNIADVSDDGRIESYEWYFGDGTKTVGENISHSYNRKGAYNVWLSVMDDKGDASIKISRVVVKEAEEAAENPNTEEYVLTQLTPGWNDISVVTGDDVDVDVLRSGCKNIRIFGLENGRLIQVKDKLKAGKGYFAKVDNICRISSTIERIDKKELQLEAGWNFEGIDKDIPFETISSRCLNPVVVSVKEDGAVFVENKILRSGGGYLIRVSKPCTVQLE
jgi:PKD repeat protein